MAGETLSTNMNLPIPGVGVTDGPTWASDINSSLTIIDAHNHSTGSGVAITPSGLNINTDLPFGTNSATQLLKAGFTSQAAALEGTNFISFIGGNLYVNDGSGNKIPITSAGGVAGSPGSIGSLASPAAATYSAGSKLFTWTSGASKAAAMDNGAVTIRETDVASAKGITVLSPASLAADYSLTLLTGLPGSTMAMNVSSAGALGTISYDSIGSSMTLTGANAIAATMSSTGANAIAATMSSTGSNAISASRTRATGTTVAAGGVAISAASGAVTSTSTSFTDVTNLSVTITTSGRPVFVGMVSGAGALGSYIGCLIAGAGTNPTSFFKILRDATTISYNQISAGDTTSASNRTLRQAPSTISTVDAVAAGTYTYKVQYAALSGSTAQAVDCVLVAYEL